MKVFITGGSGFIGSRIIPLLIANGHSVVALSRSPESEAKLKSLGATPLSGSLTDLDVLRSGASAADAVIHLGFIHDFASPDHDFQRNGRVDVTAVKTLSDALVEAGLTSEGQNKIFINTSGTLTGQYGVVSIEEQIPGFSPRPDSYDELKAKKGLTPIIIRVSPTAHGKGDKGFSAFLVGLAKRVGYAAYPEDGHARWSAAHVNDVARLYALALDNADNVTNGYLHAAAEEGVSQKDIAEAIGKKLGVPVKSITAEEAKTHYGFLSPMVALDRPASNKITKEKTGWEPKEVTLVEDILGDGYAA